MQILTSYFYQIRNFTPNMVPLSTALWDPKWYYKGRQGCHYIDKRGIINGLRAEPFVPKAHDTWGELCPCFNRNPESCLFLIHYYAQLLELDFNNILERINRIVNFHLNNYPAEGEPTAVLMFHEKYDNPCSEREMVKKWFHTFGYELKEFMPGQDPRRPGMGLQHP